MSTLKSIAHFEIFKTIRKHWPKSSIRRLVATHFLSQNVLLVLVDSHSAGMWKRDGISKPSFAQSPQRAPFMWLMALFTYFEQIVSKTLICIALRLSHFRKKIWKLATTRCVTNRRYLSAAAAASAAAKCALQTPNISPKKMKTTLTQLKRI